MDFVWPSLEETVRIPYHNFRSVWAMDSGRLSIRLCERRVAEHSSASPDEINEPCCACEEAKYEVIFEGKVKSSSPSLK